VLGYNWDFGFLDGLGWPVLRALGVTLFVSILSFAVGSIAGLAATAIVPRGRAEAAALFLNDLLRAVPIYVLLFLFWYFPYSALFGFPRPGPVLTALFAFSLGQAAYTLDLSLGALRGLPDRVWVTGASLGMTYAQTWRILVLPTLIRITLPAQMAFFIGIVRLTSIASVIGVPELVFVVRSAAAPSYRTIEAWVVVGALYIVLVAPFATAARRIERSVWVRRRW
jgi:polar amino acid transport system permease protein